jgi:PilZ domain
MQIFETLVGETHAAALRTATVASCVNALRSGHLVIAPQSLTSLIPLQCSVLDGVAHCREELGLTAESFRAATEFFGSLGYAQSSASTFCNDAAQWGTEQACFLHLKNVSAVWRRVSTLAFNAVVTLDPGIERCLPARYGENTAVLKRMLAEVIAGGQPCLDVNGQPYIPDLPQRRPAPRRTINKPCIVEHQGKTARAMVKDISSSGLGLEGAPDMTPQKVAVIEFEDGRCVAGMVVWAKGTRAGITFQTSLSVKDALLVSWSKVEITGDDLGALVHGAAGGSGIMSDTPQVLLAYHLKALKLPTFLRE